MRIPEDNGIEPFCTIKQAAGRLNLPYWKVQRAIDLSRRNARWLARAEIAKAPLVCAINAGLEQGVFGLRPGPIRAEADGGPCFQFSVGGDIPAAAHVSDADSMS